jgi:DNA replication protein DnaC
MTPIDEKSRITESMVKILKKNFEGMEADLVWYLVDCGVIAEGKSIEDLPPLYFDMYSDPGMPGLVQREIPRRKQRNEEHARGGKVLMGLLAGFEAEAMKWMVANDWLYEGQTLGDLPTEYKRKIRDGLNEFKETVLPHLREERLAKEAKEHEERLAKWREEEKHRAAERRKAEDEKRRQERKAQLEEMRPIEYEDISEKGSPRPVQFKIVAGYFTDFDDEKLEALREKKGEKVTGILAYGPSGTGKTAAAWQAIENWWRHRQYDDVVFVKSVTFARLAKSRYVNGETREEWDELYESILTTELVVFDDFGTENLSASVEEILFEVLDTRTEKWLNTIITTNYTIKQLAANFMPKNRDKIARRLEQFFLKIDFSKPSTLPVHTPNPQTNVIELKTA